MRDNTALIQDLFGSIAQEGWSTKFNDALADDLVWVATGSSPVAGTYEGYDATTTDDLRHAMKIGRQSLYDSFGGERPLYLEVLQRYNTESVIAQITDLRAAKSPLAGIRNLLLALAEEPEKRRKLGCMGVAAICAFGDEDPEITAIGHASSVVLGSALEEALHKAKKMGEAKPSLDERAVAHFLQSTMVGMKVTAKAGGPVRKFCALLLQLH